MVIQFKCKDCQQLLAVEVHADTIVVEPCETCLATEFNAGCDCVYHP
jgi:hypothetical protein